MKNTNVYDLKFVNSNYLEFLPRTQIKKEILQTLVTAKAVSEIPLVEKLLFIFFACRYWAYLIILSLCSKFSKRYLTAI